MSQSVLAGLFPFPVSVAAGLRDGEYRWWVTTAATTPPLIGGRVYREEDGYVADSRSVILSDRSATHPTAEAAATAALMREMRFGPLADDIARAYGPSANVCFLNGHMPDAVWPWRPALPARPVNLDRWERLAIEAAVSHRRYTVTLRDEGDRSVWLVESVRDGVGIVRMPTGDMVQATRWLARNGQKLPLGARLP